MGLGIQVHTGSGIADGNLNLRRRRTDLSCPGGFHWRFDRLDLDREPTSIRHGIPCIHYQLKEDGF